MDTFSWRVLNGHEASKRDRYPEVGMRQVRGWMTVVVLCCAAGTADGEEPPDARQQEAQTAFDEANTFWDAGKHAAAIARGEHALALREAVLGGTHPDVARSLDMLGLHHLLQGNAARAEPLLQRALAIREAALGKNHPDVAQTLNNLANLYSAQGVYARAESIHERALAIREAAFDKNHPDVADSLHNLANLYLAQRLHARAEPLYVRALAIREAALGKNHPDVTQTLIKLAHLYFDQGVYSRAESLYGRAIALQEAALGENHPLVAEPLYNLSKLYQAQGLYTRAGPLFERALAILKAVLDKDPPDVADALHNLAGLYMEQGLYGRAEPLYERALAVQEAALGKSHLLVAQSLNSLAGLYMEQGLYGRAEPLYERALAVREAAHGKNHLDVATSLSHLANLYVAQGLYARARPLHERTLALFEAAYGENHSYVAYSLINLADVYSAQGVYARAEPLYERAMAIDAAAFGKNHPFVAYSLNNLVKLYVAQGSYRRAEPLQQRALSIFEAAFGKNHPDVGDSLNNLADVYLAQGLYARAGPLYERALAIREATHGKNHPSVAGTLNNLAVVHLAQHRLAEALPLFTRAFVMSEQRLRQEALGFSEARLASFLQFLRTDEERLYALLRAHPDNANVRRLALAAALLLKGRSVEESSHISRTVYRSLGAQDRDTFERLVGLRTQLAKLSFQEGPGSLPLTANQQRLEELSEQSSALEADLAGRSAPLRALAALPSPSEIVDRVAAALPKDGALVEFITYVDRPLVPKPDPPPSKLPNQLRYLALVLFPDGHTRALDLGPSAPIDLAASRLRDALARRDAAYQGAAQALFSRAFKPLLPLLGNVRRIFLAPDGQLGLVPFAALHDGRRHLVDAYDFTYLTSGKDLLPRPEDIPPGRSVIVLADPDFDGSPAAPPSSPSGTSGQTERSYALERFFSTLRADLTAQPWVPLPGTRQEAEALQRLIPQAQLFLGSSATKERLLRLEAPGILHIATHGFFLEDADAPAGSRAVGHFGALADADPSHRSPDPLLRSGLV
ncbi:tetratricopeptide repeat protein, partial [Hyalangium sp.]|uniref:tetratricopeptide repeat protein n=1 Tax=Hyalangium sp. TaxID=2028555 RepID=UPI002D502B17